MNFIFYTFDPTEVRVRFHVLQLFDYAFLVDALKELERQLDRLAENGIQRAAIAWEVTEANEHRTLSTFEEIEARVRFIVDQYGKPGSGVSHGVLDLPMARQLIGTASARPLAAKPKVPCEAHMPESQKASPSACMDAIRAICAASTHDPMRKFEKRD